MPSSQTTSSNAQCEHCHSSYSLLKRKKMCAVCRLGYCANCAPRGRQPEPSFRICLICQSISNTETSDDQLLALKVKHLRSFLQAKNITHATCTEKQDLVDLIVRTRHLPFTGLTTQQPQISGASATTTTAQTNNQPSGGFGSFQHNISSFADQMNNFAANVATTVSGVINPNNSATASTFSFGNTSEPFNYDLFSDARPAEPTNTAQPPPAQQPRPQPTTTASAATSNPRARRKSLSELNNEEKIEDLNARELKEILAANFVDFKGCVEKTELIDKVRRLYRDRQNEKARAKELDHATASDSELCKICMDAIADCVFLDCGHMVTCVRCGKLLAECPICRSNIVRVVRVFKS